LATELDIYWLTESKLRGVGSRLEQAPKVLNDKKSRFEDVKRRQFRSRKLFGDIFIPSYP